MFHVKHLCETSMIPLVRFRFPLLTIFNARLAPLYWSKCGRRCQFRHLIWKHFRPSSEQEVSKGTPLASFGASERLEVAVPPLFSFRPEAHNNGVEKSPVELWDYVSSFDVLAQSGISPRTCLRLLDRNDMLRGALSQHVVMTAVGMLSVARSKWYIECTNAGLRS